MADTRRKKRGRAAPPPPHAAKESGSTRGHEMAYDFTIAPELSYGSGMTRRIPHPEDPAYRPLQVFALDPAASRFEGARATVHVPWEPLAPGPVGALIEVDIGIEAATSRYRALDLDDPRSLLAGGAAPSPSDPIFHQQMVYAVASMVIDAFQRALGRDVSWRFDPAKRDGNGRLRLRPFALEQANAYYDRERGEVVFGYFHAHTDAHGQNLPGGLVFTSMSHDVIAHEMTHALVDGLKPRFETGSRSDVAALHEGLADLVAIFQHFTYPEVVRHAIRKGQGRFVSGQYLTEVARQFGHTIGQSGAIRSGIDVDADNPQIYDEELGPHALGTVLTTSVFEAFQTVFERRTAPLIRLATGGRPTLTDGVMPVDLELLLADKASALAGHFLRLCIRALDYCPPVDPDLGNYLRALITADHDLVPDDPWGYREAIARAFTRRRIFPSSVTSLNEDALRWGPPLCYLPPCPELALTNLRFHGDPGRWAGVGEVHRQATIFGRYATEPDHLESFGLAAPGDPRLQGHQVLPPEVVGVRSLRRVGPDGQVRLDVVAEVVQKRIVPELAAPFLGGATAIFDSYGRVRCVISKNVFSQDRLARQRRFESRDH